MAPTANKPDVRILRETSDVGRSQGHYRATAIFTGLSAVISVAPLPLGGDRPLAWDAIGLVIGLLLLASLSLPSRVTTLSRDLWGPLCFFAALCCFSLVQFRTKTPAGWHN